MLCVQLDHPGTAQRDGGYRGSLHSGGVEIIGEMISPLEILKLMHPQVEKTTRKVGEMFATRLAELASYTQELCGRK